MKKGTKKALISLKIKAFGCPYQARKERSDGIAIVTEGQSRQ
jgi:hypothetical protein